MSAIIFDAQITDDERRRGLYDGHLFVYSPTQTTLDFCAFTRSMIEDALGTTDPQAAQYHMPAEEYAAIMGQLKPAFIHHPESKRFLQEILREFGCDADRTYFDVPRLRSSTSDNYLTTGIAYAWHPHRDTWYSAPQCQINWWMPVCEIDANNGMAFQPRYWDEPIANDSGGYNYAEWNRLYRANAEKHLTQDNRPLPRACEPMETKPEIRLVTPVGGMILFAAAQMHSSVPNTSGRTRFSIDFRTVHLDEARTMGGAPNMDAACTGTTMNDYLRVRDLEHVPADIIELHESTARAVDGVPADRKKTGTGSA